MKNALHGIIDRQDIGEKRFSELEDILIEIASCKASLSITSSRISLKLMSIERVMPSSHLTLHRPLLLMPPIPPSIRVFSNESTLCMRWPKYWSSALSLALPKNTQDWSPLEWTGWISLQSKGLSRVFSNTTVQRHQFFGAQLSSQSNSHIHPEASKRTKLMEVMEFQLNYFKSWKMMLWKCCTQYASKFGKLSSGHRTGKRQFSFQSQRKAMPKMLKLLHNCTYLKH